ncbi:hypothetical protein FS815_23945 [Agrobacterium vitis]|uniref:hypothetical protein n=1 Tax=Allorhizobium ampelinum TaxID=3025782 RepID=UPI001F32DC87|nr:hypothetical protein [Allorhizobium ampelinum]MCF1449845.1 hypothetical protein [Allorhizobium ampelinum]
MERHIRNQAIAEAHEAGEPVASLSERFDVATSTVRQAIREMSFYLYARCERPLPPGVSLVSAVTIHQAIGIWPAADNFVEIEYRRMELLRSSHTRRVKIALAEVSSAKVEKPEPD